MREFVLEIRHGKHDADGGDDAMEGIVEEGVLGVLSLADLCHLLCGEVLCCDRHGLMVYDGGERGGKVRRKEAETVIFIGSVWEQKSPK